MEEHTDSTRDQQILHYVLNLPECELIELLLSELSALEYYLHLPLPKSQYYKPIWKP